MYQERIKKLKERNSVIQELIEKFNEEAQQMLKRVQSLQNEFNCNKVRVNLLTELEKEKDGKKSDLPK